MRQIRSIPADRIDEFFCLVRVILSVSEIRTVVVTKPVSLHLDIVKRILQVDFSVDKGSFFKKI